MFIVQEETLEVNERLGHRWNHKGASPLMSFLFWKPFVLVSTNIIPRAH